MSHEFENGFCVGEKSWHGLEELIDRDHDLSQDELFKISGQDWQVGAAGLYYRPEGSIRHYKSDMNVIIRSDNKKILGYAKDRYQIFQNNEAWDWIQPLIKTAFWNVETAGVLKEGKHCWILLNQSEYEMVPGDKWKNYLLIQWDHTGTKANIVKPTSIRVVCANTEAQALRGTQANERIWHNSSMEMKFDEIQNLYMSNVDSFDNQKDEFQKLIDMTISDEAIEKYVDEHSPFAKEEDEEGKAKTIAENRRNRVKELCFGEAAGHNELGIQNTRYGVFQAFSQYVEHEAGGARIKDRGTFVLEGGGRRILDQAFASLLEKDFSLPKVA